MLNFAELLERALSQHDKGTLEGRYPEPKTKDQLVGVGVSRLCSNG